MRRNSTTAGASRRRFRYAEFEAIHKPPLIFGREWDRLKRMMVPLFHGRGLITRPMFYTARILNRIGTPTTMVCWRFQKMMIGLVGVASF